jgi:hypothetical protein
VGAGPLYRRLQLSSVSALKPLIPLSLPLAPVSWSPCRTLSIPVVTCWGGAVLHSSFIRRGGAEAADELADSSVVDGDVLSLEDVLCFA